MDSSTSRAEQEQRSKADILKQIAQLQAQLYDLPDDPLQSPKRKRADPGLLVPPTPSPKKRKLHSHPAKTSKERAKHPRTLQQDRQDITWPKDGASSTKQTKDVSIHKLPPSNVLNRLSSINRQRDPKDAGPSITRSSAFSQRPPQPTATLPDSESFSEASSSKCKRDENLALIEDLEPGPVDHVPPLDDPNFEKLEPNSGIRLSSRCVSHNDLQEHLRGRYYLSPSRLYSAVRLLPDKQAYDVPVAGDWITIAVVAERGPLRYTRAPVAIGKVEGEKDENADRQKGKKQEQEEPPKPTGKKYVNIRLVDFGARAKSASSATGGKSVIRGDALLSLLLFEADRFDLMTVDGRSKPKKVYKGGSGGAFEFMEKVKEGDVIALLNPRVLKPYQRSKDAPHPTDNILAITPESAESIMTLGRALDLGMCSVMKKNDQVCGSWYDKRVSDVCEYHIQQAVERRRASRPEFSIGTTGMSSTSAPKRKPAYDPARQWGLKPADADPGSVYIVSGHIVNGSSKWDSTYSVENIGREGQAKAKRRISGKDADRALMNLLEKDKEGMRAVMKAREVGKREGKDGKKDEGSAKDEERKEKEKRPAGDDEENALKVPAKSAYSAEAIKMIGFDPTVKTRGHKAANLDIQKKLETLEAVRSTRKEIVLGSRPGPKVRSGVRAPESRKIPVKNDETSFDDLPADPYKPPPEETRMVDLDD